MASVDNGSKTLNDKRLIAMILGTLKGWRSRQPFPRKLNPPTGKQPTSPLGAGQKKNKRVMFLFPLP
nr:hypothetical protein [Providencia rettgeri]